MALGIVLYRAMYETYVAHRRRVERRYEPLVARALAGDAAARQSLVSSPARHRLVIAGLLIRPLIEDRDPVRIDATRDIVREMAILRLADQYLRSGLWWRRALALHALGVLQDTDRTAAIMAALDDGNEDVRAAALDALCDLKDPRSLAAIVVRLNDSSLHRGRRGAALAAFGSQSESFLIELARIDPAHRLNYAKVLAVCGTPLCRPVLSEWTGDGRPEVRAAAFEALAHVGLDSPSA